MSAEILVRVGRGHSRARPYPTESHLWSCDQPEISCPSLFAGFPLIISIPGTPTVPSAPVIPRSPCPLQLQAKVVTQYHCRLLWVGMERMEEAWVWHALSFLSCPSQGLSGEAPGCQVAVPQVPPSPSNTEVAILSHLCKPGLVLGSVGETELTKEESGRHPRRQGVWG